MQEELADHLASDSLDEALTFLQIHKNEVNLTTHEGYTPIAYFLMDGRFDDASTLVGLGATLNPGVTIDDEDGEPSSCCLLDVLHIAEENEAVVHMKGQGAEHSQHYKSLLQQAEDNPEVLAGLSFNLNLGDLGLTQEDLEEGL